MQIEFDAPTHTYRIQGIEVPSVTQVLAPLDSFAGCPLAALEHASTRGRFVHQAMALLVRDRLDWASLDDELLPYVQAGDSFLNEQDLTVIASEMQLGSTLLRVAGTLDLVALWKEREALFDFKATASLPPTVGPQTAGYALLYNEQHQGADKRRKLPRFSVQLKPDGTYRVRQHAAARDEVMFISSLNVYHWGKQYGTAG